MKIVIFEPHPDDLLFGAGPKIFDWIKEGNDIHIITVTDGRACYRGHNEIRIDEDDVAKMRINESKKAIKFLGISPKNHHFLYFHDADGQKYVKEGIKKVKPIIIDANRIVLPSNNNAHIDHQATHDICMCAAKQLNLDVEYWVYFLPSYGRFKKDSLNKQIEVEISDELRSKLLNWLQIYQSQINYKFTRKFYTRYLNRIRKNVFGIFKLEDKGRYYNF
ncbi:MAG: PIG-L deacetylase family protein [Promethearchaeota archaeon]